MQEQWFYLANGQQHGPVSLTRLRQLASSGEVRPEDLVWKVGREGWVPAGGVEEIFAAATPVTGLAPLALPLEPATALPEAGGSTPLPEWARAVVSAASAVIARARAFWGKLPRRQKILAAAGSAALALVLLAAAVFVSAGSGAKPGKQPPSGTPVAGYSAVSPSASNSPAVGAPVVTPAFAPATGSTAAPAGITLDPRLARTWTYRTSSTIRTIDDAFILVSYRYITIGADGRFTDKSQVASSFGDGTGESSAVEAGRVSQQRNVLTFEYDNGKRWDAFFEVGPDWLKLDGQIYL